VEILLTAMGDAPAVSRCERPRADPLEWRDYIDLSHPSVIALESWLMALSQVDRDLAESEIEGLLDDAARGALPTTIMEQLKYVATGDSTMWELRWDLAYGRGKATPVRQYHGEPASRPHLLVALHRHIKAVPKRGAKLSAIQVKALQNKEIAHAKQRYRGGRATEWL
jgi:hypothetical protein